MKIFFIFLLGVLFFDQAAAQQNILITSGKQGEIFPIAVEKVGTSLFIISSDYHDLAKLTLEKVNIAGQYIGGRLLANSSAAGDSGANFICTRMIVDTFIYIVYCEAFRDSLPAQSYNRVSLCFQKIDTNLNVIIPEKRIYNVNNANQLNVGAQVFGLVKVGDKFICPYYMQGANQALSDISKAVVFNASGTVILNDTLPVKDAIHTVYPGPHVTDCYKMNNGKILFTGRNMLTGSFSAFDFVVTDTALRLQDTFKFKPIYVQQPPAIVNGNITSGLQLVVLPTGSWISGSTIAYSSNVPPLGNFSHTSFAKYREGSRFALDSVLLFRGRDSSDLLHNRSYFRGIGYNKLENRVYYSDMTNATSNSICDGSNYIQIVSADTNLQTSWRKFVYSGNGQCFLVNTITTPDDQKGVWVSGVKVNSSNYAVQEGFIFHIDSATTTSIEDGGIIVADRFQVFPIPAKDYIVVSDFLSHLFKLTCFDMQGKIVAQSFASGTKCRLDISMLPIGSYLMRVTTNDGSAYSRVISKDGL